jgi:hypothetical protein
MLANSPGLDEATPLTRVSFGAAARRREGRDGEEGEDAGGARSGHGGSPV